MVAHEGRQRISESMWHTMEKPGEMVKEYPVSSMLLAFGVGLGVGVVIAQAACSSSLLNHYTHHEPTMSEKLSRQIYDAVSSVLPQSLARQIHA
jgi:hypothetical protein